MVDATFKRKRKRRVIRHDLCAKLVETAVGKITRGCEIYGLTKGNWNLIDLIVYCLKTTGPADVVVSTWTASNENIQFANALFKSGDIRSLKFVVDFSFPNRQPEYCAALRQAFGDDAIRITKNHAKFVTIKNDGWALVLRTSMNLNENRRLENYEISDSPEMLDFITDVVDQLFKETTGAETFARKPGEQMQAFYKGWGEKRVAEADETDPTFARYFGDGSLDTDLRRSGVSYD